MKFDKSKVVSPLEDDLERWVGWRGFFSDKVKNLELYVENENRVFYCHLRKINDGANYPFATITGTSYQWFYPVTPPNEKEVVPFENVQELIDWFCDREGLELSESQRPFIWIKAKSTGNECLIDGFVRNKGLTGCDNIISVCGHSYTLKTLSEEFTLLDGTPIGKEVQE